MSSLMFRIGRSQLSKISASSSSFLGSSSSARVTVAQQQQQQQQRLPFSSETVTGEPYIPPYQQRVGEAVETIRARLLYQSRKRGMLENGILLSTFAAKYLDGMSEAELKEYDRLINLPSNDWDIYYWAVGVKPIPPEFDTPVLQRFIEHVRNAEREQRFKQPDLN